MPEINEEKAAQVAAFVAERKAARPATPLSANQVRLRFHEGRLTRVEIRRKIGLEVGAGEGQ